MSDLISRFYDGSVSDELFTLPNGINEFDIVIVDGVYYLAYDDQTTTQLVSATTLNDLATATHVTPRPAGRYPSILHDGGRWHLWVWETSRVNHYVANEFSGPYEFSDALPLALTDIHVRRLSNGLYYAVYKDQTVQKRRVGTLVAHFPEGPWTNMGHAFDDADRALFEGEAADPALFEADGETFLVFSGWDGSSPNDPVQRILIAPIDPATCKALTAPVVIVSPELQWQQRGGHRKVFNGIFLRETGLPDRLFFAHNVTEPSIVAGWGYLEARSVTRRIEGDLVRFLSERRDPATGAAATLWGSAALDEQGLTVGPTSGGAYGPVAFSSLGDFSLLVDFTAANLPANGGAAQIAYIAARARTSPMLGLWQFPDGRIYWEVKSSNGGASIAEFWTTPRAAGQRTRIVVTRRGEQLTGFVNGSPEVRRVLSGPFEGLQEWGVGNPQGADQPGNSHQLDGTVHRFVVHEGPLVVSDI